MFSLQISSELVAIQFSKFRRLNSNFILCITLCITNTGKYISVLIFFNYANKKS